MRQLAISLILLRYHTPLFFLPDQLFASNGALPNQTNGASAEKGKKRVNEDEELASALQSKAARRSLGSTARVEEVEESKVVQEVKKKGRRSLAVVPTPASPAGRLAANSSKPLFSFFQKSRVCKITLHTGLARGSPCQDLCQSPAAPHPPLPSRSILLLLRRRRRKKTRRPSTILHPW